ncbi:metallophosphoesterase [Terriglobus sp. RCC_193]|uniref:metallophosphoesterase n=1 Tax=Terriglobus sp. RCC_193 TaxID=3239218 RepID=UPI003524E87B
MLMTVERTVRIRNLPAPFHGFRIAQLSDFHFHNYDESFFVRHAVQRVNELAPDMVALTGDFVTASSDYSQNQAVPNAYACAEILSGLKCPTRLCSLGNHDAVIKRTVSDALQRNGLKLLMNQFTALERRGERIWISGIADAYFDVPDLSRAMPQRKPNEPIILLGHEPDFADVAAQNNDVDLMLAGHTHGGQVRLPFLPALLLPAMGEKYVEDLHTVGSSGMQLYVNRGLGCMHLPFRFNCPPELTLLTLQPA